VTMSVRVARVISNFNLSFSLSLALNPFALRNEIILFGCDAFSVKAQSDQLAGSDGNRLILSIPLGFTQNIPQREI
jgi:hypothetical protein